MKFLPVFALVCAASLLPAAAAPSEVQQLLTEAQAAYLRGDIETAKGGFEMVSKIDPRNPTAIGYLRTIAALDAKRGKGNEQEKQLAALIVPRVEFREATLGATLEYLKKTADKLSAGKIAINFVVQIPDEQTAAQKLTLNLTNVPFTEVLRYVGGLTGLTFAYEKYAIVVKPKTADAATAAEPAPAAK